VGARTSPLAIPSVLRRRVSFHLAVPMPDAWFFGDLEHLPVLIAPEYAERVPITRFEKVVRPGTDPEHFRAKDVDFSHDDGAECAAATRGPKPRKAPWMMEAGENHPKRYVQYLLRDPPTAGCHVYRESQHGVRMLHHMSWSKVLDDPAAFTFLRAMVRDLENALGTAAVGIPRGGEEAELTCVSTPGPTTAPHPRPTHVLPTRSRPG
jgi:hypothetical protein